MHPTSLGSKNLFREVPMPIRVAAFLFLACAPLLAQTRFDGTWKMKMDTLRFSGAPEEYFVANSMYQCLSCVPKVDVKVDGTDQIAAGHENYYDTIAVRVLDGRSVNFLFKKLGKPVALSKETVSADGRTMVEEFQNLGGKEPVTGKAGFVRVGDAPAGSHALSGKWQMRSIRNDTQAGTLTTYRSIPNGLRISDGGDSFEAKFDGKDYPLGRDWLTTVSLTLVDENTLQETDKHQGEIMTVSRMTVSRDGKTMAVESLDNQRGTTMTYTAEKLPSRTRK
jgi:hypothetical protein